MKEIIYNYDYLEEDEINNVVVRVKAVVVNNKNGILLGFGHKNFQLIGGHVEEGETFEDALVREVEEETGIEIEKKVRQPFLVIKYYCRDYPEQGQNTKYIANYYEVDTVFEPNYQKINLTDNEKEGMFELKYLSKRTILKELEENVDFCSNSNVVLDTIEVIKEYLKNHK